MNIIRKTVFLLAVLKMYGPIYRQNVLIIVHLPVLGFLLNGDFSKFLTIDCSLC